MRARWSVIAVVGAAGLGVGPYEDRGITTLQLGTHFQMGTTFESYELEPSDP